MSYLFAAVATATLVAAGPSSEPAPAPEIVCHRGAHLAAPENTHAAAARCFELGGAYVEVDVRTSRDGDLFIVHDDTVDRTTDGKGKVNRLHSSTLEALDAGSWFAPEFAEERLPRLDTFLSWVKGKGKVYLDVKAASAMAVALVVRNSGMEAGCFVGFDDHREALRFANLAPELALKVNVRSIHGMIRAADQYGASIVEIPYDKLAPEVREKSRELGVRVMIYEPSDSRDVFEGACERGVDLVNIDHIESFLSVRDAAPELRATPSGSRHVTP